MCNSPILLPLHCINLGLVLALRLSFAHHLNFVLAISMILLLWLLLFLFFSNTLVLGDHFCNLMWRTP